MPCVIHSGDEFKDFPEAPSATVNEGTQAPYRISQHRTIVEEERKKDGSFSELHPLERQKMPFWNMV